VITGGAVNLTGQIAGPGSLTVQAATAHVSASLPLVKADFRQTGALTLIETKATGETTQSLFVNGLRQLVVSVDTLDARSWERDEVRYDQAGVIQSRSITYDDGLTTVTDFVDGVRNKVTTTDTRNARDWDVTVRDFTQGNLTSTTVLDDNGLQTVTRFADGAVVQRIITDLSVNQRAANFAVSDTTYDAAGRVETLRILGDTGLETVTRYHPNGKIDTVTVTNIAHATATFAERVTQFDANGVMLRASVLTKAGLETVSTYQAGELVSRIVTDLSDDGATASFTVLEQTYGANGRLLNKRQVDDTGLETIQAYHQNGRLARLTEIDDPVSNLKTFQTRVVNYAETGRLVSSSTLSDTGLLTVVQNDHLGQLTTVTDTTANGSAADHARTAVRVGLDGKVVQRTEETHDGLVRQRDYQAGVITRATLYDVADRFDWARIETHYTAGRGALRLTREDDGDVVVSRGTGSFADATNRAAAIAAFVAGEDEFLWREAARRRGARARCAGFGAVH
jgi:hypothetical protein